MKHWKVAIGLVFLCCAYTAVLFRDVLFTPESAILFRDLGSLTLPSKKIIADSLRLFGELPLWNPFALGGAPFLADPSFSTFYPLNLIFLIFPRENSTFALSWFLAIHFPIALLGFYLLLRSYLMSRATSLLFAFMLGGSGFVVSQIYLTGSLAGVACVGWLFYFWTRYLKEERISFLFLSSLMLAMPLFAADPQFSYLLSIFFLPFFTAIENPNWRWASKHLGKLFFLTFLVASPQLIPTLELIFESTRAPDSRFLAEHEVWSLHPVRWLEIFLPLPFGGSIYQESKIFQYVNGPDPMPFIFSIYPGFLFLPLWFAAFAKGIRQKNIVWLGLTFFFILVSMGTYLPISFNRLAGYFIPLWSSFRYPERLTYFAILAAAFWIAGEMKRRGEKEFFSSLRLPLLFVGVILSLLCVMNFPSERAFEFGLISSFCCVLGYLLLEISVRNLLSLEKTRWVLVAIVLLNLALCLHSLIWAVPSKIAKSDWPPFLRMVTEESGALSLRNSPRFYNPGEGNLNWPLLDKISGGRLSNPGKLTLHQYLSLTQNTGSLFELSTPLGFVTMMNPKHRILWEALATLRPEAAFSVKGTNYFGTIDKNGNFHLSRVKDAIPLLSVPSKVEFYSRVELLSRMLSPDWNWNNTALLPHDPELTTNSLQPEGIKATLLDRSFREVRIQVESSADLQSSFWLLWNESFDKHWTASVNGKEVPYSNANYWASAILVPWEKGERSKEVLLRYENPLIAIGQAFFLIWCLLWMLFFKKEKGPRKNREPLKNSSN